jgi:hypothetical protein
MNENNKDTEYNFNTSNDLNKSNPPKKKVVNINQVIFFYY